MAPPFMASTAMRTSAKAGNDDRRQLDPPGRQFLLQFQAAHARHANIQHQARRSDGLVSLEEFVGRAAGTGLQP